MKIQGVLFSFKLDRIFPSPITITVSKASLSLTLPQVSQIIDMDPGVKNDIMQSWNKKPIFDNNKG